MKIKQLITIVTLALIVCACGDSKEGAVGNKSSFTINAKIDSINYKTAYLAQYKDGRFVKSDSVVIESGVFSFTGSVKFPSVQYILFDDSKERIVVFVENSDISITGTDLQKENVLITGSAMNVQLDKFITDIKDHEERLKIIVDAYYAAEEVGDEALLEEVDAKYVAEDSLKVLFIETYINDNLNSVIAPYLSLRYLMGKEVDELEKLSNSFSADIRNSEYITLIEERIALKKSTQIGQPAPLFSMDDKDGESNSVRKL